MELSKDNKYIRITNRKPVDHTKYILEADKELISIELDKQHEKIYELEQKKTGFSAAEQDKDPDFNNKTSSSGFWVDDIQMITFGGFSSRFWMLRKHFNSQRPQDINLDAPFYSWECLTIDTGNRDVDLVIRCEQHMKYVLKFMISGMRTLDGRKGTADKMLKLLNEQSFDKYRKENKKFVIQEAI